MILSDKESRVLCTQPEQPLISPFDEFRLQGASYGVSMSDVIHVFKDDVRTISLTDQNAIDSLYKEVPIPDSSSFILKPMEYILVTLKETICIPSNMIAHIRPRTKFTRLGIIVSDQHCNPGYQGTLQIGLRNVSPNSIGLTADMPIAQIVFEELKSEPSPEKVYSAKADASYHNEQSFLGAKFIESDFSPKARKLYEKIMSGAYLDEN